MTNQASLEQKSLKGYKVKKYLYSYKFTIYYTDKKERERDLSFIIGKKNKQVVEERLGNLNVNIV